MRFQTGQREIHLNFYGLIPCMVTLNLPAPTLALSLLEIGSDLVKMLQLTCIVRKRYIPPQPRPLTKGVRCHASDAPVFTWRVKTVSAMRITTATPSEPHQRSVRTW